MPGNVDRLLQAAARGEEGRGMLRDLVSTDPSLCAQLLHLANSCCDPGGGVDTIDDAIDHVGLVGLAQLVGASQASTVMADRCAALEHLDDYFAHSRETSLTCRVLAEVVALPSHDREMFAVAGLVHDIGRLIILMATDRTGTTLMGVSPDRMHEIVVAEEELLGMNHCDVGMEICRKWHFTPTLWKGVQRHHTPLVGDDFDYVGALVFLAHFVAESDYTGEIVAGVVPPELLRRLKMTPARFDWAKEIYAERSA
jgi:putative nucleotidyltransferase with HDIG domain